MPTEEDVQSLREGYEAFNVGDFELAAERIAPDASVSDRAEVPDAQTYSGREQVLAQFQAVSNEFEDYRIDPISIEIEGDYLVAHIRQSGRGRASGVPVEGELFHVWEVHDRAITDMRAFTTRDEALAYVGEA